MSKNNGIYYDLEAINNYIFGDEEERSSSVEITEVQGMNAETNEMVTVQKTIREVKESNDMTNKQTIRYDMIKLFIDMLNEPGETDVLSLTQGQQAIMNTMLNYGLAKKIENYDNRER